MAEQLEELHRSIATDIQEEERRLTSGQMQAFAGSVRRTPEYINWFLREMGRTALLHFRETRRPIGQAEASELLRLKTTRGGPEQLSAFQRTVKALLGVSVDAFEAEAEDSRSRHTSRGERISRSAEMDIDEFLVEANGAGIREALRLILDLELKKPAITLIEEPEVHLHPGLEKIMHSYLISKSAEMQIFTATHSTNFVDVSSRQAVFIVSRGDSGTTLQRAISEDDILRIPGEIGLRPSTVFMFDRLVFVEGPSDEAVLREFARHLSIDLTSRNVGFVAMGGASNFAHFAADATLDLLSRRQIPVWFVVDRDEREDHELKKMLERIGPRANLIPLSVREMENYLLSAEAICTLILRKLATSSEKATDGVTPDLVQEEIASVANELLERAVELRVARKMMGPIYVDRISPGTMAEKLEAASKEIQTRLEAIKATEDEMRQSLGTGWIAKAQTVAPGSDILDGVFKKWGLKFVKERDSARLAALVPQHRVPEEIEKLLQEITAE